MLLKNSKVIIIIFIAFLAGSVIGCFVNRAVFPSKNSYSDMRVGDGFLTNPLLDYEIGSTWKELALPKKKVEDLINQKKDIFEQMTDVSVYFRDLNNGPWFGIEENSAFSPASLMKVPVAMSIYKASEEDPSILGIEMTNNIPKDSSISQIIIPEEEVAFGEVYTIEELVRRMIVFSDNGAMFLLLDIISEEALSKVFIDLRIEGWGRDGVEDFLSVKTYASFFRILYNASYLNRANSEKMLELLVQSTFKEGISKGIPENVLFAHKFGERTNNFFGFSSSRQVHDCGIVYYPDRPYLLCIMTRGNNYDNLKKVIQEISALVYESVDSQHRSKKQ